MYFHDSFPLCRYVLATTFKILLDRNEHECDCDLFRKNAIAGASEMRESRHERKNGAPLTQKGGRRRGREREQVS